MSISTLHVHARAHVASALLMAKILGMMAIIPRATVTKVYKQFRHCIEAMMEAGGEFSLEIDFA
jgi:hypothetical protein